MIMMTKQKSAILCPCYNVGDDQADCHRDGHRLAGVVPLWVVFTDSDENELCNDCKLDMEPLKQTYKKYEKHVFHMIMHHLYSRCIACQRKNEHTISVVFTMEFFVCPTYSPVDSD